MGISKTTIRLWIRLDEGEGHVITKPRSSRPNVTSQDDKDRLIAAARQAPKTTAPLGDTAGDCPTLVTRPETLVRDHEAARCRSPFMVGCGQLDQENW
ncbi:hypothetical protein Pmani_004242 [Petrolisthes manimaculis]|uniref:Uncharacterized protein n=1 Tax=Petrolisthes manimaculis TaxID=1843537 RepID=A0AAE1ULN7_9EUCA|nr:hypothetical protein Pmani_004242 [Petrolisthes manimaculis]